MRQAFTLIELSIVLVILGLLVGGIMAEKSLIRAAELRSITSDVNRYKAAIMAYRDKYMYLPGDQPNAYQFFGTAVGCTNALAHSAGCNTASASRGCNGDGTGQVSPLQSGNGDWGDYETWRGWQFMAYTGMIEGSYSGTDDPTGPVGGGSFCDYDSTPGLNIPASRIANAGYIYGYVDSGIPYYAGMFTPASAGHYMVFGLNESNDQDVYGGAITGEEAWNIDTKLDDGLPRYGTVIGRLGTGGSPPASYQLNATTNTYSLYFKF